MRDDIVRQFRYYLVEHEVPEVAQRFLEAVEESIAVICRMPEIGTSRQFRSAELRELRSWPVKDFEDIRIHYIARDDRLRVLRVLHGRRDIKRILERDP